MRPPPRHPHLRVPNSALKEPFTSTGRPPHVAIPQRDREPHANRLLGQLNLIDQQIVAQTHEFDGKRPPGTLLEFEGEPDFELNTKSLDLVRAGIEVLSVKQVENRTLATVFVPDGKLEVLISKVREYRDSDTTTIRPKPKNRALVDSITSIRRAQIRSLWTDNPDLFPQDEAEVWWEVWLRAEQLSLANFHSFAKARNVLISERFLTFQDRIVALAYCKSSILADSIEKLACIAELRLAKQVVNEFIDMRPREQREWAQALNNLLEGPSENSPRVCILDTGVSVDHPLLRPVCDPQVNLTCNANWGTVDQDGHGTEMAGIVAHGADLVTTLQMTTATHVPFWVESVKILPLLRW